MFPSNERSLPPTDTDPEQQLLRFILPVTEPWWHILTLSSPRLDYLPFGPFIQIVNELYTQGKNLQLEVSVPNLPFVVFLPLMLECTQTEFFFPFAVDLGD